VSTSICQIQQSGPTAAVVQLPQFRPSRTMRGLWSCSRPHCRNAGEARGAEHPGQFRPVLCRLIETYFVGKLGTDALAGVALVFPVVMLTQMISAGAVGGGISSAVARALAAVAAALRTIWHCTRLRWVSCSASPLRFRSCWQVPAVQHARRSRSVADRGAHVLECDRFRRHSHLDLQLAGERDSCHRQYVYAGAGHV